ncbi:MAG: arylsulfatase [Planctomycetales bacterium]|nr:arylsulfatase [Planctomycetales bacterium]
MFHKFAFFLTIALQSIVGKLAGQPLVAQEPGAASLPNVVFILVDDMGYGDPGCYNGNSKIRTPNIDAIAAGGMKFTDAHASGPLCHMSRYGLMTGRYPFRADVSLWPKQALIAPGQTTLASMLKQQGYQTAMVGKWHLGFNEQGYDLPLPGGPCDVGFDSFFGIRASTDIPPYFYIRDRRAVEPPTLPIEANRSEGWSPIQGEFWRAGLIAPDMQLGNVLPRFTEEAISVIEKHGAQQDASNSKPLFLYLAYPAPHTPWLPSPPWAGKSSVGLYGDFAEMVDAMIGRVLEALDDANLSEQTLLVISSDNGPVWYPTDAEKYEHDSCGGLRGMKADAWEAGHRMPFIVRWPNVVEPGTTSDQIVSFVDMLATLAAITNYQLSPDEAPDSFDFSPVLQGAQSSQLRSSLLLQSGSGLMTIRDGTWKLIDGLGSGGFSNPKRSEPRPGEPKTQLYNLSEDPSEATNLAGEYPEIVQRLLTKMAAVQSASGHRE